MYAMTAAHKTLPLPAYVRVTNLQNGRSVVVRVNDRGPFVGNRIIDLSYTAAAKLDMLRNGTAMVEVRSLDPIRAHRRWRRRPRGDRHLRRTPRRAHGHSAGSAGRRRPPRRANRRPAGASPGAGHGRAGPASIHPGRRVHRPGERRTPRGKIARRRLGKVFVRDDQIAGRRMYRVRIGPVPDVAEFDRVVAALERAGIGDAHLALD